jgi:sirohydrochlorin cobaltochelatase
MHALILFSHGSLLCGAGEALEAHAERLRASGEWDLVAVGYLNYSDPPFADAAAEVIARGATRVTVAPYFLVPGYFVTKSLPEALAPVRAAHPGVEFVVGEALGEDEALADALWEAALAARTEDHWRDPLTRAARSCRPSPVCPLYGTPACPKVPVAPETLEQEGAVHA